MTKSTALQTVSASRLNRLPSAKTSWTKPTLAQIRSQSFQLTSSSICIDTQQNSGLPSQAGNCQSSFVPPSQGALSEVWEPDATSADIILTWLHDVHPWMLFDLENGILPRTVVNVKDECYLSEVNGDIAPLDWRYTEVETRIKLTSADSETFLLKALLPYAHYKRVPFMQRLLVPVTKLEGNASDRTHSYAHETPILGPGLPALVRQAFYLGRKVGESSEKGAGSRFFKEDDGELGMQAPYWRKRQLEIQSSTVKMHGLKKPANIPIILRPLAIELDLPQIENIIKHYVENTSSTSRLHMWSTEELRERMIYSVRHSMPIVVAVYCGKATGQLWKARDEKIVGVAISRDEERNSAMAFIVDVEVFVHPEYTRGGIGSALLDRLMSRLSPSYTMRGSTRWEEADFTDQEWKSEVTRHILTVRTRVHVAEDECARRKWISAWIVRFGFETVGDLGMRGVKLGKHLATHIFQAETGSSYAPESLALPVRADLGLKVEAGGI